ncbi:hypothetical protein EIP91_000615 [Steccherinum ochraceum]|uniref:N-acetyltransferase domain-containing protein n=1 Tax=Steccherinum ochraceum TaxID=92696 RepID=A0A4R0RJK4_9APHY|nr:hypothetical protein EIP91_000615 [Steccherinum ochraceum]
MPEHTAPAVIFRPEDCVVTFQELPSREPAIPQLLLKVKQRVTADPTRRASPHVAEEVIASIHFYRVRRHLCRHNFRSAMLRMDHFRSDELRQLSTTVFDQHGLLNYEFIGDEWHKGSGCFGVEMDYGTLIYIEDLRVKKEYRNQGLGSWVLQHLFDSKYVGLHDFVVLMPGRTDDQGPESGVRLSLAQCHEFFDKTEAFFRKNGFRRIGRTDFMAFSNNPEHPSRKLAATDDVKAHSYKSSRDFADAQIDAVLDGFNLAGREFPLHFAIQFAGTTLPYIQLLPHERMPIDNLIVLLHSYKPAIIHSQDRGGYTPLHIAAQTMNRLAIETLLNFDIAGADSDLHRRDNDGGLTPLEMVEFGMRREAIIVDGVVKAYPEEGLRCAYMLRKAMGEDVGSEEEYLEFSKWGCTCDECGGGWFSPRFKYRMMCEADSLYHTMECLLPDSAPGVPLGPTMIRITPGLEYVPAHLHANIDTTFAEGFHAILWAIRVLCDTPDIRAIPTPELIFEILTRSTNRVAVSYFDRGGQVEFVLDYVLDLMIAQSPIGDATFDVDTMEGLVAEGKCLEWVTMPRCQNDLNFELARARFGMKPKKDLYKLQYIGA